MHYWIIDSLIDSLVNSFIYSSVDSLINWFIDQLMDCIFKAYGGPSCITAWSESIYAKSSSRQDFSWSTYFILRRYKLASSVGTNERSVNLPSKVEWVKLSLSVYKFLVQVYNNGLHFVFTFGTLVSGYKYYIWYTGKWLQMLHLIQLIHL